MPRKRRTKLTHRSKPKQPDDDSSHSMPEDEEKDRLESFLKDFDIEVEKRVKAMRSQMKSLCSSIHHAFNLEILRLPSHVRDMKRSELFGEKEVDEIKEEVSSSVDKLLAEQLQTDTAPLKDGTSTQNKKGRTRKKTATTKKTKRATTARRKKTIQDENDPTSTVVKPTRQSTRASARKRQFETPANSVNFSYQGYDTPFMTPKFDPRLPVTPAMARQPKKGEVLMSFAGSPVINENGDIRTQAGKTAPSISKEPSILTNLQVIVIFLITVTLKDGFLERILTFCTSNLQRKRQA
ncbi:putative borealin-like [Apostichopus japonicus]|uniref:Putative borealin-like n=1 Tax=Stichopus japonicus TaxID=307972 RepID=A0A2G8JFG5_STIJA|nr:putative borealin-like [Apostichopus japonicus]